jgi:hypothetical protein
MKREIIFQKERKTKIKKVPKKHFCSRDPNETKVRKKSSSVQFTNFGYCVL